MTTRNQRLVVVHALARYIGENSPEHIEWCGTIRAIPFRKAMNRGITYLEKSEMDALLAAVQHRANETMFCCYSSTTRVLARMRKHN